MAKICLLLKKQKHLTDENSIFIQKEFYPIMPVREAFFIKAYGTITKSITES